MTQEQGKIFRVGVDTGGFTGIGVFDCTANRLHSVHTTDFFGAREFLLNNFEKDNLKIFVEVPPEFIYARNNERGAVRDKKAIHIGGNRREAILLAESFRREGFDVTEVPPIRQTKWTADEFKRHLKSDLRTNQHCRDAARIAWYYAGKRF